MTVCSICTVVCACSLTVCEPTSLLVGRSFETSTVPNLKFPNYDSACERSHKHICGEDPSVDIKIQA